MSSSSTRLVRSVFRSTVRFARSPDIRSQRLRVDPVTTFGLSKQEAEGHMGSGKSLLESGEELVSLLKRVLQTMPSTADNLDKALLVLKKLNIIRAELKNTMQQVEFERGDDPVLWQDGVEYVGGTQSSPQEPLPASRPLPLFILGRCFFPEGETWLHVFETRYLEMMQDCAKADDCFGYVFGDDKGGVASVGVICKITARKPLDDGRLAIRIEGTGRFKILSIANPPSTPYVLASVDPALTDLLAPQDDTEPTIKLESQLWGYTKYYYRLLQLYDPKIRVPRAIGASHPKADSCHQADRRERFSFAVANVAYLQTSSPRRSQLLLQTRSTFLRLQAQGTLLSTAAAALAARLVDMGLLTEAQRVAIQQRSIGGGHDDDVDVLP